MKTSKRSTPSPPRSPSRWSGGSRTMLIEPNTYLPAVMRDFLLRGGKIEVRTFATLRQIHDLAEHVVFNCTGIGARALWQRTTSSFRCAGSSRWLEPQADVDYIYLAKWALHVSA